MTDDIEDAIRSRATGGSTPEIDISDRVAFDTQADDTLGSNLVNTSTMTDRGFKRIGEDTDSSRAVFRRDGVVVKFDHVGLDPWRNENERKNWEERLPEDALDRFAPVLETGEDDVWLAMEYAETEGVTDQQHADLLYDLMVVHNLDMTDPHPDNVGVLDGRAVLIDYNFRPQEVGETQEEREAAYEAKLWDYSLRP